MSYTGKTYLETTIGRLQVRDVHFNFTNNNLSGMTLILRQPKEGSCKTTRLGIFKSQELCPTYNLFLLLTKSDSLRIHLTTDHTVFLGRINDPTHVHSVRPTTVANLVKLQMQAAGIDTTRYTAHSTRSASSTKANQTGFSSSAIKQHANWSEQSNTWEKHYRKSLHQDTTTSTTIINSLFNTEKSTTLLEVGVEPTRIILGTTPNTEVGETKTVNVVRSHSTTS
ncbi:hypothetical protein [Parasitella parasitica]|uniref:Tyr recombinase domain-containing protein n=1 Tax=Parasitella parasitica TaxID=35722 RepID=A0A0B7NGX8_9FUNG|nr:hypothetical protein [Parasitella parasitica]